jgi:hypothetical protein
LELIPLIYEIFKKQYPQILGQALVLDYGWVHAGMWSVVKAILSKEAKEKLKFIKMEDLTDYITIENIPTGTIILIRMGRHEQRFYAITKRLSNYTRIRG